MAEPDGASVGPDQPLGLRWGEVLKRGWPIEELRGRGQDFVDGWSVIEGEHEQQPLRWRWEVEHPHCERALQSAGQRQPVRAWLQRRLLEHGRQLDEREQIPCRELEHLLPRAL